MYLSIFVGPFSRDARDDVAVIDLCIDQSVRSARAGFAMVTFGEQHFNNYEPYCNPFVMAGHLAGELGDAWFGTTIVPLPFHNPLRVAEDASLADLLTRGRFILGMSAGRVGPVPDWDNFGIEQGDRAELFASNLEILRGALAHRDGDSPLRYDTKWGRGAMNGRLMPASWREAGPLMAIGSNTDETIQTIGQSGLPLFLGPCPPAVAGAKMQLHRDSMQVAGFTPEQIDITATRSLVTRNVIVADTDEEAWSLAEKLSGRAPFMDRSTDGRSMREMADYDLSKHVFTPPAFGTKVDPVVKNSSYVQGWLIVGSPESVVRQIKEYEALNIPQLNVRFTVGLFDPERGTPKDFEASFQLFLDEVVTRLSLQQFPAVDPTEVRAAYRT
jgi:alkanesulfonate monooxygenase SsuD/methylene tetrahydromethanopterin reductase-like flavin-dependent oxidoreductase (luciferase family)